MSTVRRQPQNRLQVVAALPRRRRRGAAGSATPTAAFATADTTRDDQRGDCVAPGAARVGWPQAAAPAPGSGSSPGAVGEHLHRDLAPGGLAGRASGTRTDAA